MNEIRQETHESRCSEITPKDRQNMRSLLTILLVWAVSFIGATHAIKHGLLPEGPISWLVAAIPTVLGIAGVFAYRRYLREADELQRVIQLEALAWGFGVGWLVICGYPLFVRLGAPAADSSHFLAIMVLAYSFGSVLGRRRFL